MRKTPTKVSAHRLKHAVRTVCEALQHFGISTATPELLRQAKLGRPGAYMPMWRVLHDLVLILAVDLRMKEPKETIKKIWKHLYL